MESSTQFGSLPPQLHTLDLGSCDLGSSEILSKLLSPALLRLTRITELDLSSNNASFGDDFFKALSQMEHLTELLLQHNRIGSESAIQLIKSIHPSAPISRVWLQNNGIEAEARDTINQYTTESERSHPLQIIFGS